MLRTPLKRAAASQSLQLTKLAAHPNSRQNKQAKEMEMEWADAQAMQPSMRPSKSRGEAELVMAESLADPALDAQLSGSKPNLVPRISHSQENMLCLLPNEPNECMWHPDTSDDIGPSNKRLLQRGRELDKGHRSTASPKGTIAFPEDLRVLQADELLTQAASRIKASAMQYLQLNAETALSGSGSTNDMRASTSFAAAVAAKAAMPATAHIDTGRFTHTMASPFQTLDSCKIGWADSASAFTVIGPDRETPAHSNKETRIHISMAPQGETSAACTRVTRFLAIGGQSGVGIIVDSVSDPDLEACLETFYASDSGCSAPSSLLSFSTATNVDARGFMLP